MLFSALVLASANAVADKFEVDYNPYLPLCQGFKTYLEQHADDTHWCSVPKANEIEGVTNVKWQPATKELATKLVNELYAIFPDYKFANIALKVVRLNSLLDDLAFMALHQTKVDLDHNGQVENVLQLIDKRCDQNNSFSMNIVFNDKHQLDAEFYFLNRTHSGNEYSEQFRKMANFSSFSNGQIILYNGRSYLFGASKGGGFISEPFSHSVSSGLSAKDVCSVHKKRTK